MIKDEHKVIVLSLVASILIWVIGAVIDTLIFHSGTFLNLLLFGLSFHELYFRLLFVASFIVFGAIISMILSKHRLAEEVIKKHLAAMEASMDGMAILDKDGKYIYLNDAHTKVYGYNSPGELIGKTWKVLYNEEEIRRFDQEVMPVLWEKGQWRGEAIGKRRDGSTYRQEVSLGVIEGKRVVCVVRDITRRKQAEEAMLKAIAESQQRKAEISALLEASRAVLENREFKDTAASIFKSSKDLIGAVAGYITLLSKDGTKNEVIFLDPGGFPCSVDPTLPMPVRGLREVVYRTGKAVYDNDFSDSEWMKFIPEGHANLANVLFAPLVIKGKTVGLLGLGNKLGGFTENDAQMASAFGELAAIALHNSRLMEAIQKSRDEMELKVEERTAELIKANEALQAIEDELRQNYDLIQKANVLFEQVFSNIHVLIAYIDTEFNFIHVNRTFADADGRSPEFFVGKNYFDLYPNKENEAIFKKVLEKGEPYFTYADPFEHPEHPERGVTYWDWSVQPIKDTAGNIHGLILSLISVTEKILLQAETMRAAHLASLGELAAGVAHEINNPLNGIINYAQMLSNRISKGSMENDIANRIIKEGDRIANIVRSLLSFARKREEGKEIVNIHEMLFDTLFLTETQMLKESIELKVNVPHDLPEIIANSQQIQQVFLNIINNARYALNQKYPGADEDKILEISGEIIMIDSSPYLRITFYDRGTGIPVNILDKVANPFFSTKPGGKGTGLGLSISHGIISDHGGKLLIESIEGEFTRVIIDIPVGVKDKE